MSDKRAFEALLDDLLGASFDQDWPAEKKARAAVLAAYEEAAGREGQPPVAWRRWTDSAYERRPRWVYFDEPADGAEPLFTHPAPKADASVPTIEVGYEGNASMTGIHISDETWASVAKLKARTAEAKSDAAADSDDRFTDFCTRVWDVPEDHPILAVTIADLRRIYDLAASPARVEGELAPFNCRQRAIREGKAYMRSSCAACGKFSPRWKECDAAMSREAQ